MLHDGVQTGERSLFSNHLQRAKSVSDNWARLPDDSVKVYLGLFHAADRTHPGKDDGTEQQFSQTLPLAQTANSQSLIWHRTQSLSGAPV